MKYQVKHLNLGGNNWKAIARNELASGTRLLRITNLNEELVRCFDMMQTFKLSVSVDTNERKIKIEPSDPKPNNYPEFLSLLKEIKKYLQPNLAINDIHFETIEQMYFSRVLMQLYPAVTVASSSESALEGITVLIPKFRTESNSFTWKLIESGNRELFLRSSGIEGFSLFAKDKLSIAVDVVAIFIALSQINIAIGPKTLDEVIELQQKKEVFDTLEAIRREIRSAKGIDMRKDMIKFSLAQKRRVYQLLCPGAVKALNDQSEPAVTMKDYEGETPYQAPAQEIKAVGSVEEEKAVARTKVPLLCNIANMRTFASTEFAKMAFRYRAKNPYSREQLEEIVFDNEVKKLLTEYNGNHKEGGRVMPIDVIAALCFAFGFSPYYDAKEILLRDVLGSKIIDINQRIGLAIYPSQVPPLKVQNFLRSIGILNTTTKKSLEEMGIWNDVSNGFKKMKTWYEKDRSTIRAPTDQELEAMLIPTIDVVSPKRGKILLHALQYALLRIDSEVSEISLSEQL